MNISQLKAKVDTIPVRMTSFNYDCSEYAEDAKQVLGGRLYTFTANKMFHTMSRGQMSIPFVYHTVLLVEVEEGTAVVDLTSDNKVVMLGLYRLWLQDLNPGVCFEENYGEYKGGLW